MLSLSVVTLWLLSLFISLATSLRYDPEQVKYNLNQNQSATDVLDYWGQWPNHDYQPSPDNWRFPWYTLFLDRFVNGDPTNDDANGTAWEHDLTGTQLRNGGDIKGLQNTLDYLQGMGIKGLYLAGSPMINLPWGGDGYSPLDLSLLDAHHGEIDAWRECIAEIHSRGMYVILDNTMATMADLIGFDGFFNVSAPFSYKEHDAAYKSARRYQDFSIGNTELSTCDVPYPRFYNDSGFQVFDNGTQNLKGCRDSEFDQYGDIQAFSFYPEWQRQISKFGSVQDRLREWKPSVRQKISRFACLQIAMLDVDGFRMDKGIQVTVDAQAEFASEVRECAAQFKKNNFFMTAELVGGNAFNAIYVGRGKELSMENLDIGQVVASTYDNTSDAKYIRDKGKNAVDAACFNYSIFRSLTRFLGLDGQLAATFDTPVDFVDSWHDFIETQDMNNVYTGKFDPRHMYGTQNQDQFRWPGIINGTERQLLGNFITTLLMPGSPILEWGEEQAFYVLDSTAANYLYGRQAMTSTTAWQDHGCYKAGATIYVDWPGNSSLHGCQDDWNSLDHRDPSHPVRNILKAMYEMRNNYPVLNDGFYVEKLSNQTHEVTLRGSFGTPTELGLWSVVRSGWPGVQDLGQNDTSVWLLYSNLGNITDYTFDCTDNDTALIAPFDESTTVRNLFYPYDEQTLETSPQQLGLGGSTKANGCLQNINMPPYGYMAYVPSDQWVQPAPVLTAFVPGHDARILSTGNTQTVPIEIHFSVEMDCDVLKSSISFNSTTTDGSTISLDKDSASCKTVDGSSQTLPYIGQVPTNWTFTANLQNVAEGIHEVTITNATAQSGHASTNAVDHFLIRVGKADNPMVFPRTGNYSKTLLSSDAGKSLTISHSAPGADQFRYSTNFGSSWSAWQDYKGASTTIQPQSWSGTKQQAWSGDHVSVQYWSQLAGSSNHVQQGDVFNGNADLPPRRYPHFFVLGSFNEFGFDEGLPSTMHQNKDGVWQFDFVTEFPSKFIANVWGVDTNGKPDLTRALGDVDNDTVLDLLGPVTLEENVVFIETHPASPHVAYRVSLNDGSLRYSLSGIGSRWIQATCFFLLAIIPILTGIAGVYAYLHIFYGVKFNVQGITIKQGLFSDNIRSKLHLPSSPDASAVMATGKETPRGFRDSVIGAFGGSNEGAISELKGGRNILIATMEYFIEDWSIEVKIGGLGVMARLMAKNLTHQNLIWVVPCLGGIEYPVDERAEPMNITVFASDYSVEVQYHRFKNITYVLLDAPVFRAQTKAEPYPRRMDDFDSAVYYSAWNSCVAEVMRRFPQIDLYHINDYHGALAPLHLLPQVIPCCLSLHNAEFQGLWPIRTDQEMNEICGIFNLNPDTVRKYVQFGEVFNLLHAGASYLRIHQKGFGAVGVSAKYGKRSFARYPIFWGLKKIGSLPNPDPTDTGEELEIAANNPDFEANRVAFKHKAQEWAGLDINPQADLFCFVGRWSEQKGIDLIADIFPWVMKEYPNAQLICIGPVIDLYGKFAAVKLQRLMSLYPGRVYSKPEFTQIPPYVFGGTDFALIPSRDEPYGLVAVEFGRKGALCVGAKVGGLGSMPGWWYTIESTTTRHLLDQFKKAIQSALICPPDVRAGMRKQATTQRFPVRQWKMRLSVLQENSIRINQEQLRKGSRKNHASGIATPTLSGFGINLRPSSPVPSRPTTPGGGSPAGLGSAISTRAPSPSGMELPPGQDNVPLSLGRPVGPGHAAETSPTKERRGRSQSRNRLSKFRRSRASSFSSEVPDASRNSVVTDPLPPLPTQERQSWASAATFNMMARGLPDGTGASHPPAYDDDDAATQFVDEYYLSHELADTSVRATEIAALRGQLPPWTGQRGSDSQPGTPGTAPFGADDRLLPPSATSRMPPMPGMPHPVYGSNIGASQSNLSLDHVAHGKKDYKLQNVAPDFTDPTELYFHNYEKMLDGLDEKSSEGPLCVEEYIKKSEKQWYTRYHDAKLGKVDKLDKPGDRTSSIFRASPGPASPSFNTPAPSIYYDEGDEDHVSSDDGMNQFLLNANYVPPKGLKKLLLQKFGDWPVYSFLLAFGQIVAANSYQIVLLTGEVGQPAEKLYIIAGIYGIASILWWLLFRRFKSLYVVTLPFAFYGLAFLSLAISVAFKGDTGRGWVQNIASGFYAFASASGSFYFALNFGSEGSVPVKEWTFRASVIQGTQQIYVVLLWFWGARLTKSTDASASASTPFGYGPGYSAFTVILAILFWAVGAVLYFGLPDYYHQSPGQVPSFYRSIARRRIILWFFVVVLVQNFFLSAPYGRNWKYLWSSNLAPAWAIAILVVVFFIGVWAAFLFGFSKLSRSHSWILPIFAVSLGAPRWCQMLWGTSGMGQNVAFAGSSTAGAMLGRALWLWLGTLDALQGVGFGMILLQTLTRFHVVFTLVAAQVLGSIATIVARAVAPDKDGPGAIFPNLSVNPGGLKNAWFWFGLIFQLILCVGFFRFFRREQLQKP